MAERNSTSGPRRPPGWLLFLVVAVIVVAAGYFLSAQIIPTPRIGIIRLEGEIDDSVADNIAAQASYATKDPSIRAVVLKVNSPGGGVTASENLYYSLLSLRDKKPLVVSIDTMAASGGYYAASAGDVIYAKPSSSVGNIGVVSLLPTQSFVDEELLTTGPMKLFGSPRDSYIREMEILKQGFLRAVEAQRKTQLKASPEELSRGELYVGVRAKEVGLIDSLGTTTDAVDKAAEMAKLASYETVELGDVAGVPSPTPSLLNQRPRQGEVASLLAPRRELLYMLTTRQEARQ